MKLTLSTRNRAGVVANLAGAGTRAQRAIRALVGETAAKEHQRAFDLCPKRTGRMAEQLRVEFSEGGYAYELGWHASDFPGAFYPLYQELGFRHAHTGQFIQNPCLFPARDEIRPEFRRALAERLSAALRRSAKRGGASG